jgi:hypothetical protein
MTPDFSILIFFVAFISMFGLDVAYVLYLRAATKNNPFWAAFWALAIHIFGAISVLSYVGDHRYLFATCLGTFFGTFAVVEWAKGRRRRKNSQRALQKIDVDFWP